MTALGLAWALVVVAGGGVLRPAPRRAVVPRAAGGPSVRRPALERGALLAAVAGVAVAAPWWGAVAAVAVLVPPRLAARRRRAAEAAALARELPEIVDLLAVATSSGLSVAAAVGAVAPVGDGALAAALGTALAESRRGRRLADALDDVPARVGEPARPLVAALTAGERYGAPLAQTLDRLADEARHERRRAAETAARRVPVALLFPLVCCILPAFALLTVAPLVAGALRALRL